jgi:hypothetical protein
MRRFVSLMVVVAIAGSLLLLRFDACPQPMNIIEYFRTFGFFRSSPLRVTFLGASTSRTTQRRS